MHIHGLQKLAMVDYPGKLAATVFTGGCNLRCPFCHNALLVTRLAETPEIPEQEVLDFLASAGGFWTGWSSPAGSRCSSRTQRIFCGRCGNWALP